MRTLIRTTGLVFIGALLFAFLVPVPTFDDPLSTVLLDHDGILLGATLADDDQWRFGPSARVPDRFARAAVAYEDRRFRHHPGFDPLALLRAAVQNLRAYEVVSGGSTLTMQVVRLSRGDRPRTYLEKLVEIVLAVRLELAADKEEILALYAEYAPFGGNTVGLEAAAWRYFGRPPDRLSWGEAAALAVLPNSPALVHPGRNRELLRSKRDELIERLVRRGIIDRVDGELARAEPLPSVPLAIPRTAPHLLARAHSEGVRGRIRSTVVARAQRRATRVVAGHAARLRGMGIDNAAAVIAEVDTGRVLAYVGNVGDPADGGEGVWVDVVTAPRSTGSILKPFLYAAMLDAGEVLPTELVPDVPTRIGGFAPENYDQTFSGAVPASTALARSLNVPAVRMLRSFGVARFYRTLRRLGMTTLHRSPDEYGLTLILGGAEATLWDLVGMYAGLGRVVNRFGGEDEAAPVPSPPVYRLDGEHPSWTEKKTAPLDPGACYETLRGLLEVTRPGVERSWRRFASSRRIAWKTGTSYGHRDAWAIGITPGHVVGVWAGNADGEGRSGLSGSTAAAPILFDLFDTVEPSGWFAVPESRMTEIEVCAASGMRPTAACAERMRVTVPLSALPGRSCPYCRVVHLGPAGRRVHGDCESVERMRSVGWFVLPPTVEWYYRRAHSDYRPLPALRADCRSSGAGSGPELSCVHPADGSRVFVPVQLDGRIGRVVFRAAHRRPETRVFWHLDETYVGETSGIHRLGLAPEPGDHTLLLIDEDGEEVRVSFTVLAREP